MRAKIRAVLVDDEKAAIRNITYFLEKYFPDVEVVGIADNAIDAVKRIREHSPDIIFLDISMPGGSGFDMLDLLGPTDAKIVFVTAYAEHAIRALKANAYDYLLKPLVKDDFVTAVGQVCEDISKEKASKTSTTKLLIPVQDGIEIIRIKEILYCKADNVYTNVYLEEDAHIVVSKAISFFEQKLVPFGFLKTHRSYLVAAHFVKRYSNQDGGGLELKDGTLIPLSKSRKDEVLEKLATS